MDERGQLGLGVWAAGKLLPVILGAALLVGVGAVLQFGIIPGVRVDFLGMLVDYATPF